jgi:outer membrane immunogenic protein
MNCILKSSFIALAICLPTASLADWTGAYGGIAVGQGFNGTLNFPEIPEIDPANDGTVYGGFAGYQVQNGNLVYGGELALTDASVMDLIDFPTFAFASPVVDVKGRVGYATGQFLVYGALGLTSMKVTDSALDFDGTGFNIGAGVDYMISDQFIVGAEYLSRQTTGNDGSQGFDLKLDTLTIRAAYKF